MKLCYLGGALEVGASSILIKLDKRNILLDCGIRQKKSKDKLPDFSMISEFGGVDDIIISHAHMDHIGSLPLISKEYPNAKIYMNRMTMELSRVLLYDSLKIMNYQEGEIPVFNEDDVCNMFDRIVLIPYQKEVSITDSITLTLYMAGHIAGASCCYLKAKEGTILYTGDFSIFPQHAISGLSIPKLRPDVVISEATYGDKLHANRESEEIRLVNVVNDIIGRGGKVLIPVFALGRSQEVLLILKKAMNKGLLKKIPVYVDGMVRNINNVFQNNPLFLKESLGKKILRGTNIFYDDNVIRVEDDNMRNKIIDDKNPSIIIASSGMLSGGMSEFYASKLVENSNNGIVLTGYQDEESNGRMLLNLLEEEPDNRKLSLNNHIYQVNSSIDKVGLSAHADKQEMKSLFEMLSPRYIVLGHGDAEIIHSFALEITKDFYSRVYTPNVGEIIDIEVRNPRKQINKSLEFLYSKEGEMDDFYKFIKENYGTRLFTLEDLCYIYYGKDEGENVLASFTEMIINSPYFTSDKRRYFMFRITDELELDSILNKEITAQDIEEVIKYKFKDFPYKKVSYYLNEKRVVLTFDFPKVIGEGFDKVSKEVLNEIGIIVEKNDNINNRACELVIKEIIGENNIDKISFLPLEDKFSIKVYEKNTDKSLEIEKRIGYEIELILVPRKEDNVTNVILSGERLEQNDALNYIDNYFKDKGHKPYKKSIKNGNLVLSFISYEVGCMYLNDIKNIENDIKWKIELNRSPNVNMIFNVLDNLLSDYGIEKVKNPSFLPVTNSICVKVVHIDDDKVDVIKNEFKDLTGLVLQIDK